MRGVAVLLLALALEGVYLASGSRFPVQSPTQPIISISDADEIRVGDVLAGNLPSIDASSQQRKAGPSKSIFKSLVNESPSMRSGSYLIAFTTIQILALIAPSRFQGDTSLS